MPQHNTSLRNHSRLARGIATALLVFTALTLTACPDEQIRQIQETVVAEAENLAVTEVAKAIETALPQARDAAGTRVAELQMTAVAGGSSAAATAIALIRLTVEAIAEPIASAPITPVNALQTATGFYWPTGSSELGASGRWMASSCNGKNDYFKNTYHIGRDMAAPIGAEVVPISDGKVFWVSRKRWGEINVGLLVEHTLSDGTQFTAVYGHIRTELKENSPVTAGKPIGTVGAWPWGSHLHFGIRPGKSNTAPYGAMDCPANGDPTQTNGFVDPVEWIMTKSPGPGPS